MKVVFLIIAMLFILFCKAQYWLHPPDSISWRIVEPINIGNNQHDISEYCRLLGEDTIITIYPDSLFLKRIIYGKGWISSETIFFNSCGYHYDSTAVIYIRPNNQILFNQ